MDAISLKLAGVGCVVFFGAVAMCRNSKVDLRGLPPGSLFEVELLVSCLITGQQEGGRCECSFTSTGGQSYVLWLPESEVLRGDALIPENSIVHPGEEGGIHLRLDHVFERPIDDQISRIPVGAQVRHIRRFLLVALKDVRDGVRLCKHYENVDRSVDEWLSLDTEVWHKSQRGDRH